jgi:hypothetical protein
VAVTVSPYDSFKIRYQCVNCRMQSRGAWKLDLSGFCRTPGSDAKRGKSQKIVAKTLRMLHLSFHLFINRFA